MLLACAAAGLAAAALGWWVVWVLQSEDIAQGAEWRYDVSRINELRRAEPLYRFFQPILTLLGRFNRLLFPGSLPEIGRQIQAAGLTRFWLPEEYLGRAELLALLALPVYVYVLSCGDGRLRPCACGRRRALDRLATPPAVGRSGGRPIAAHQAPHPLLARPADAA